VFAARQRLGEDVLGYAHAVKIDALAGLGKLLAEQPKAKGSDRGGRRSRLDGTRAVPSNSPSTLADLGIDKKTSALSQRLAALSDSDHKAVASRKTGTPSGPVSRLTLAEMGIDKKTSSLLDLAARRRRAGPPASARRARDVGVYPYELCIVRRHVALRGSVRQDPSVLQP